MHKQLLFELEEQDGYYVRDGKNLGNKIKLYCYKSDENNIYLDTPVIDYPDYYTIVKNDGTEIPLRKQFEEKGYYKKFYAIVSKHKKLTSIEPFFIEECNTFYSIEIKKEVKELIEAIGFENLYVDEKLFDNYLITYAKKANGYELLFFIRSDNKFYDKMIIDLKLKVVKQKIDMFSELYKQNGLHMLQIDGKSASIVDIKNTITNKVNLFKNNKERELMLLNMNDSVIDKYSELLYKRIEELIYQDWHTCDNYLYFGYTDDVIVKGMKKFYGLL